jgi:hypothetical protein
LRADVRLANSRTVTDASASRASLRQLEDEFVPPLLETAVLISRDLGRPAS